MNLLVKRMERRQLAHRLACFAYIAAIGALYLTNFILRVMVCHATFLELFVDYICPIGIIFVVYWLEWEHNWLTRLLCCWLPTFSVTAIVATITVAIIASVWCKANFVVPHLAAMAMTVAPYALKDTRTATSVIVADAIGFSMLANWLEDKAAAIMILLVAAVLIMALPKLTWFLYHSEKLERKLYAVMLIGTAFLMVFMEDIPMLGTASVAFILVIEDWIRILPVLLAEAVMIAMGFYLLRSSVRINYYLTVCFHTIITIQTVGYFWGWSSVCPFLDGDCYFNTLFLFMATQILPPKQKPIPRGVNIEALMKEVIAETEKIEESYNGGNKNGL